MPTRTVGAKKHRPIAVDLFAGAGGLSLGLEQAGFDVVASVEYDPVHATTHAYNFPLTEVICDDLSQLDVESLQLAIHKGKRNHGAGHEEHGEVDLIAGGPPCQGFSWIGKRKFDDARNDLIFHFFRIVSALKPRYFIMENVPGMASGQHKALLDDLIEKFRNTGYLVHEPEILNAAYYGAPQDRRRLILIGQRYDVIPAVYPTPTVAPIRPVRSTIPSADETAPTGPTVWDAIGDLPNLDQFEALLASDTVLLTSSQIRRMTLAASSYARQLRGIDIDGTDLSYPRVWNPQLLTSSARTVHTDISVARFAATPQGKTETISRFLRLPQAGLCNTLRAGTGGERGAHTSPRPIHPTLPRVISVREAARLHSFPDWFRFHVTKWNGFRQIGNAVPPVLGRALGREIIKALGVSPAKPLDPLELVDEQLLFMGMKEAASFVGANHDSIPKSRRTSRKNQLVQLTQDTQLALEI